MARNTHRILVDMKPHWIDRYVTRLATFMKRRKKAHFLGLVNSKIVSGLPDDAAALDGEAFRVPLPVKRRAARNSQSVVLQ
jgi:hypothetical protein